MLVAVTDQPVNLADKANVQVQHIGAEGHRDALPAEADAVVHPVRVAEQIQEPVGKERDPENQLPGREGEELTGRIHQAQQGRQNRLQQREHVNASDIHVRQHAHEFPDADLPGKRRAQQVPRLVEGHIPAALAPADLLPHGGLQGGGLFVIHAGIMVPEDAPAFQRRLHLHFEILGQGTGVPAAELVQIGRGHGKPCAADAAVDPQAVLRQADETVAQREAGVVDPGNHALLVLHAQIALDEIRLALVQILAVDFAEHIGVHHVVRVEDHQQVIPVLVIPDGQQRLFQGDGLAGRRVRTFLAGLDYLRAEIPRGLRGVVGAVVRDDIKIVQFFGIIHALQIPDDIPDDFFLVMGRYQHQEPGFRVVVLIVFALLPKAEKADHNLINHQERQKRAGETRSDLQNEPDQVHFVLPPKRGLSPVRSHILANVCIKHHKGLFVKYCTVFHTKKEALFRLFFSVLMAAFTFWDETGLLLPSRRK